LLNYVNNNNSNYDDGKTGKICSLLGLSLNNTPELAKGFSLSDQSLIHYYSNCNDNDKHNIYTSLR